MTISVVDTSTGTELSVRDVTRELARRDGTPTPATYERSYTDDLAGINQWAGDGIAHILLGAAVDLRALADKDRTMLRVVSDYPVIADELLIEARRKVSKAAAEAPAQTPTRGDAQGWVDRSRPVAADRRAPAAQKQVPVSPPTEGKTPGAEPRLGTGDPPPDLSPDPTLALAPDVLDAEQAAREARAETLRRQAVLKTVVDRTPVPPPKPFVAKVPWRQRVKRGVLAVLQRDAEERAL